LDLEKRSEPKHLGSYTTTKEHAVIGLILILLQGGSLLVYMNWHFPELEAGERDGGRQKQKEKETMICNSFCMYIMFEYKAYIVIHPGKCILIENTKLTPSSYLHFSQLQRLIILPLSMCFLFLVVDCAQKPGFFSVISTHSSRSK
jgi:hypothetical protein